MRRIPLAALASLALAGAAQSATVTVMVVYDSPALLQVIDSTGYAQAHIDRANTLLVNSQIAGSYALAYAHPTAITPPSSSPSAILDWLKTDPQMQSLRNQYAADLVVAIAGNYSDSTCGLASGSALPNTLRSESQFAVVTKFSCVDPLTNNTLGHELSHLSGAGHENVPNANAARPYAHPWIDTANHLGTVMMSADVACGANCQLVYQLSSPNLKFPNTTITAGNSATADNQRMVKEGMDVLSLYRPLPIQAQIIPAPSCSVEIARCIGGTREVFVSWYSTSYTPFAEADVDISYNSGATWGDWYNSVMDYCLPLVPSQTIRVRARVRSGWGDSPFCSITLSPVQCSPGDDDF